MLYVNLSKNGNKIKHSQELQAQIQTIMTEHLVTYTYCMYCVTESHNGTGCRLISSPKHAIELHTEECRVTCLYLI